MERRDLLTAGAALALAGCTGARTDTAAARAVVASLVTRWDTDEWARGSYSALPPGTPYWVREELGKTVIRGKVVLAGEYTASDYPATVHGAYTSGERAARRLLAQIPDARSVLVARAGLAGLRAAQIRQQAGRQVIVAEARDRVGGRVHTDTSMGVPAAEGCGLYLRCHGQPDGGGRAQRRAEPAAHRLRGSGRPRLPDRTTGRRSRRSRDRTVARHQGNSLA